MKGQRKRHEAETAETPPGQAATEPAMEAAEPGGDTGDGASELALALAKAEENWDRYVRAAAELENVRKRASKDVENAHRYALERFGRELLPVKDSLELGLSSADNASVESLLEGSQATLKILGTTMQQFGIEELDPAGEPFDPSVHEAISMQPSDDVEPGSIVTVVQKGYTLNGRLLRPAMVIVASE
jgi:molecular chaperone GrpE